MTKKSGDSSRRYEYPRPAVTVDVALFRPVPSGTGLGLELLLVRRDQVPFRGRWALPGGFVRENEALEAAVARELHEETGLENVAMHQVAAVGTPGRDPRGHTVTVLYTAFSRPAGDVHAGGDAASAAWHPMGLLPPLAFDHDQLVKMALADLRKRAEDVRTLRCLLPDKFTLAELQSLTEVALGRPLDVRNFRRRVLESSALVALAERRRSGAHRPAQLFRFAEVD